MPTNSIRLAKRLGTERSSIFDKMNRLAEASGAVNLGQGFPDFAAPKFVREAAVTVVSAGHEQYSRIAGEPSLRQAIADYLRARGGPIVHPDDEVTVTCGCQEGLAAALLALADPGDEVIVFEPFFETYRLCVAMADATPRFVTLRPPDFAIDEAQLRAAFGPRTRVLILNTPHNPTGRVFSRDELAVVARLCVQHDVAVVTDEVYEELVFDGEHLRMATFNAMRERTVTLSSLGKTFSVTGWKIGWAIAPPAITQAIRRVHQALAFSIAKPLQLAAVAALGAPPLYFEELRSSYRRRRDLLTAGLRESGFVVYEPAGTYFLLADVAAFERGNDDAFCDYLTREIGVTAIPASYLYAHRAEGQRLARFAFCKTDAIIVEAARRMRRLVMPR